MNGPISFYDVNGKLTARAHNGPISLKNFSGDADITARERPDQPGRQQRERARSHGERADLRVARREKRGAAQDLRPMRRMVR